MSSGNEIYEKYKDAVVTLLSYVLVQLDGILFDYTSVSSGFFIKHHYIMTAAHEVLLEPPNAPLPQQPPYVRVPPTNAPVIRCQRIWAQVYNVNGSGKSYSYELDLIGVDGAGDSALLKINYSNPWNQTLPIIKSNPFFQVKDNHCVPPGTPVYQIGFTLASDFQSFVQGIIRNNKFATANNSTTAAEQVTTDNSSNPGNSGSATIDSDGYVVGVSSSSQLGGGNPNIGQSTSSRFFAPVIKALIKADRKGVVNPHLELITDVFGNFWRYNKGYMVT